MKYLLTLLAAFFLLGCEQPVETTEPSPAPLAEIAPAPEQLTPVQTPDDLLNLVRSREVDTIAGELLALQSARYVSHLLPVAQTLWSADPETLPDVPADVLAIPLIRLRLGALLIRDEFQQPGLHSDVHNYAIDLMEGEDRDIALEAMTVLATFDHPSDVGHILDLTTDEQNLRPVVITLMSMCIPNAAESATALLEGCTGPDCAMLRQEATQTQQQRMDWCEVRRAEPDFGADCAPGSLASPGI